MKRKVFLEGEIGSIFGREFSVVTDTVRDALRCIDCNVDGFKKYLIECAAQDIGFTIDVAGEDILEDQDLLLPIRPGDITITPIAAGAKSGAAKIFAAIVIAVVLVASGGTAGVGFFGSAAAGGLNTAGLIAASLAVNLALTGLQQIMAPDPATDNDAGEESYLFNGSQQNIIEGDPVPVLYGELRVPGRPISFETLNEDFHTAGPAAWGSFSTIGFNFNG
jgi:predicted phage tail protein